MSSVNRIRPDYWESYDKPTGKYQSGLFTNSYFSMSRSDTQKRKRPVGRLAEMEQATSVTSQWIERSDYIYRTYTTNGSYFDTSFVNAHGLLGGSFFANQTTDDIARNRMIADARERSVNLGQMLAEYKQTAKLFPELATRFVSLALKLRRSRSWTDFQRAVNNIQRRRWDKNLANDWLQFQYGVKPLIGDLNDSIDRIRNGLKNKSLISYCRGSAVERLENTYPGSLFNGAKYIVREYGKSRVSYVGIYVVRNENMNAMLGSLGLSNPLALAWELVPYSFVVDWFINVGEVLESLDNPLYFTNLRAIKSIKSSLIREVDVGGSSRGFYKWNNSSRGNLLGVSSIATPVWKPGTSLTHIANGLALLRGLSKH